jgi:hypothetical protein
MMLCAISLFNERDGEKVQMNCQIRKKNQDDVRWQSNSSSKNLTDIG